MTERCVLTDFIFAAKPGVHSHAINTTDLILDLCPQLSQRGGQLFGRSGEEEHEDGSGDHADYEE